MSIFERNLMQKIYLDDTTRLTAKIINAETIQGHTEYTIRVQRGSIPDNSWHVHRRYNEFVALNQSFQCTQSNLSLPPKKIIGNMDAKFISERQAGLQKYLNSVLDNMLLSSQLSTKLFLDPKTYGSFSGSNVTQMKILLRGEVDIEIVKQLPKIGWRLRKDYFLIKLKTNPNEEFLLSWIPFGPDKYMNDKQIQSAMRSLSTLKHANVSEIIKCGLSSDGTWIVRKFYKCGTILDIISNVTTPLTIPAVKKYGSRDKKTIPVNDIVEIISQILHTLAYFYHKGIAYGHLHLGNIVFENGIVKLLDLENSLLGLPPYYRESFIRKGQIHSIEFLDVYSLGLVIYEMYFGKPFKVYDSQEINQVDPTLRFTLEWILNISNDKNGKPTISELLTNELFYKSRPGPQPCIKLSSTTKQYLTSNSTKTLDRLKEDYVKFREEENTRKMYKLLPEENRKLLLCCKKNVQIGNDVTENSSIGSVSNRSPSVSSKGSSSVSCFNPDDYHVHVPYTEEDNDRHALLGAICNFNKNNLKKVKNC